MITLVYDPIGGTAYPDGICATVVDLWALNLDTDITVRASTENIFLALRVAIKQGRIPHRDVLVEFNGQFGEFDKDGRSEFWPDGFCDYSARQLMLLLGD